jgi:hypothetical protein
MNDLKEHKKIQLRQAASLQPTVTAFAELDAQNQVGSASHQRCERSGKALNWFCTQPLSRYRKTQIVRLS